MASKRTIDQATIEAGLEVMSNCRKMLIVLITGLPVRHPIRRNAEAIVDDIDALACLLTGSADYFHDVSGTSPSA